MSETRYDAVIVGAGPNGLAAANRLAEHGLSVLVLEGESSIGGGARTCEVTLPGFQHDICSAIHPMGVASPYLRTLNLEQYGLGWVQPELGLAHPLKDGSAAILDRSLDVSCASLGPDGPHWRELVEPFLEHTDTLMRETLRPIRVPRHPLLLAHFGLFAMQSCKGLSQRLFATDAARMLFGGCAAHSFQPLEAIGTGAFGLMLVLTGHAVGWPCARGGSVSIVNALAERLRALGGVIETSRPVRSLADLPPSRAVLFNTPPRRMSAVVGRELPDWYRLRLHRFRHGPGVFKLDWALDGPIPWRAEAARRAGTVHLSDNYDELLEGERSAAYGKMPRTPFILVAQQSLFDETRAPSGKHTGWAYCHVPAGSTVDLTERLELEIERFAPGFRDLIRARHAMNCDAFELHNANMIGGDIGGGANTLWQTLFRPVVRFDPYSTPDPRFYLCSSSTPPGGGVHGMCGFWAANSALQRCFGLTPKPLTP